MIAGQLLRAMHQVVHRRVQQDQLARLQVIKLFFDFWGQFVLSAVRIEECSVLGL
jgi:hypothetical protein